MKIARFRVDAGPTRLGAVAGDTLISLDALGCGDDVVAAAMLPPAERKLGAPIELSRDHVAKRVHTLCNSPCRRQDD